MKAIIYEKSGPPEVLHLEEVEKPTPKDDEVLVSVQAASRMVHKLQCRTQGPFYPPI